MGQLDHDGRRTTSSSRTRPVPNWEASTTSSGRNRLPPAEMMWRAASVTSAESAWAASSRAVLDHLELGPYGVVETQLLRRFGQHTLLVRSPQRTNSPAC